MTDPEHKEIAIAALSQSTIQSSKMADSALRTSTVGTAKIFISRKETIIRYFRTTITIMGWHSFE